MSRAVYAVLLHGRQVGVIHRRGGLTKLVFDADYWERPHRMVLGRWFEDRPRRQQRTTNRVPTWFSNLLPEGRLRDLSAREQAVSGYREMDLLERIGRDLPGAVSVELDPDQRVDAQLDDAVPSPGRDPAPAAGPRRASLAGMVLRFSHEPSGRPPRRPGTRQGRGLDPQDPRPGLPRSSRQRVRRHEPGRPGRARRARGPPVEP